MAKKQPRSQLMDLFLHVGELLGYTTDREIATLANVSVDNVANWRSGTVKEFKTQTLRSLKKNLTARVATMREQLRQFESSLELGLIPIEIEEGSGPAALQRQFADRMSYDYLGHRFLYFEPQGALAWEKLIRAGYAQDCWLAGVTSCISSWMDTRKDGSGLSRGRLARALGLGRAGQTKGLDLISLGPGEGGKEIEVLKELLAAQTRARERLSWLTLALVDVSIPLLFTAAKAASHVVASAGEQGQANTTILPFCADFEEGGLSFLKRLPTGAREDSPGMRLVMVLGNVVGNVRDEDIFFRQKLDKLTRPGDLLWLEVGLRLENLTDDPLFAMTGADYKDTAAFSNRRLLLEGPYRRREAAIGRSPGGIETQVWVREGDGTSRVPGSINFCHDLHIQNERRVCSMLYSRRYQVEGLSSWLEARGYAVERVVPVKDSDGVPRTVHLLLERK